MLSAAMHTWSNAEEDQNKKEGDHADAKLFLRRVDLLAGLADHGRR